MTRRVNSHMADDALYLRQKAISELRSLLYGSYIRHIKAMPPGSEGSARLTDFYHDAARVFYDSVHESLESNQVGKSADDAPFL